MRKLFTLFDRSEDGYRGYWVALTACLTAGALFLVSCSPDAGRDPGPQDDIGKQEEQAEQRTSAGPENSVSFLELSQNPEEYYGKRVTVSATVGRTFESRAVSLVTQETTENQEPVEDESVLAVGKSEIPNLSEGQSAQVTGEVREFNIGAFENDLGIDLKNDLYVSYEGRPAIVADSVGRVGGTTGGS